MEIKLSESQLKEIEEFIESVLNEERLGMELINRGHINDGCETVLRARNKWSGAIEILHKMNLSVDIGEYNEVTLKEVRKW